MKNVLGIECLAVNSGGKLNLTVFLVISSYKTKKILVARKKYETHVHLTIATKDVRK